MYKLIVTETYKGYDISWDYSNEKKEVLDLLGGRTTGQFKLDDTSTNPDIIEFKELLRNCPGARMAEMLGRTTPIFETEEEAQHCINNVMEPYLLSLNMAGKKL